MVSDRPGDGEVQFLQARDVDAPGAGPATPRAEAAEPPEPIETLDVDAIDPDAPGLSLVPAPRPERLDLEREDHRIRRGDVDAWGRSESLRALARTLYDPIYKHWFRAEWE